MDGYPASPLALPLARTLADQVANQLRHAILTGQLKPGQHIVEREIAEAMHLSRGPVRDALMLLENEGLVIRYAHRGTFVAWLTLRDADEIYSLREALETLALKYALAYATDEQVAELDQIVNRMASRMEQDYTQYEATSLDLEFHEALCRVSGHSRVLAAWTALRVQVRLLILTHRILQPLDFREKGVQWHRDLVDALRERNAELAYGVLRRHLAASFESVRQAIDENGLQPEDLLLREAEANEAD